MMIDLTVFLPYIILIGSAMVVFGSILIWLHFYKKRNNRPPFTKDFLRSPGESLNKSLNDIQTEITVYLTMVFIFPIMTFSIFSWSLATGKQSDPRFYVAFGLISLFYFTYRLMNEIRKVHKVRLGLEGERAVGEELNLLMLQGYHVYHDVPKEQVGNIDHVVIGKNGVFAIETKAISKSLRGEGPKAVEIEFDGQTLTFPNGFKSNKTIKQVNQHADWLTKMLTSALGEPMKATPVVAIPGWFIKQTARIKGTVVLSANGIEKHFKLLKGSPLDTKMVRRISHILEQRCRTVKPWVPGEKK